MKKTNSMKKKVSLALMASMLSISCLPAAAYPVYAEDVPEIKFMPNEGTGISMTEERSFTAEFEMNTETTVDEVKAKLESGELAWTLSRTEGYQDEAMFPYQYLGGKLEEWKTVATKQSSVTNPETNLFDDITTTVEDKDGDNMPEVTLSFSNKLFFGWNGIDNRDRAHVRNTILDYTGPYELALEEDGKAYGKTEVQFRPYDTYHTNSEIDQQLAEIAAMANEKGIYAHVEEIGKTVHGRSINAIFVAKSAKDITDYEALAERAETEPDKVLKEIENGSLEYKVPVMYSNVHADEIIGSDGCMEFLHALVENADASIPYKTIASLTEKGQQTVKDEMAQDEVVWSDLIKGKVTGVGYIQGNGKYEPTDPKTNVEANTNSNEAASVDMSEDEMKEYYNMEDKEFDVKEILDDVFFIVVPAENADGVAYNVRTNANSFDLNRDNTYQTQPETQAMTRLIAKWNPVSLHEIHGYYTQFQVEPCSPTHEPNVEYDLFMQNALKQGEAFGAAAISNNDTINSFNMPMRDYLKGTEDNKFWEPFDDMSTSYTPQYALVHGVNAYTVELPYGSADAVQAVKYGFLGNAAHVAENKDAFFTNQLKIYDRGLKNIDADEIRPWYVNQQDEIGAEADIFRKKYEENDNFFPEYYVIPLDAETQEDTQAASDMIEYLLRNDVRVKVLKKDTTVNGKEYKAGTAVIDMHQAKRNMANAALYSNVVIANWGDLYSEPLTNFSDLRGFDMDTITTPGAFANAKMKAIDEAVDVKTTVFGEGYVTVLSNNSVDTVKAVNDLLGEGKQVGYITEGEYKGDFVLASEDFKAVKDNYVLVAYQMNEVPTAKVITKTPTVYVPGRKDEFATTNGQAYGVKDYSVMLDTWYGWDIFAFEKQLGFNLATTADEADIIVGGKSLSGQEIELVKEGKPYVGYTTSGLYSAYKAGVDLDYYEDGWFSYDALTTVTYPEESMVTDKYVAEGDDIMYGYGGAYFTKVPEGAKVLVKTTGDYPIEGFMSAEHIESYKNTVQAIEYKTDTYDMTLFANTMTDKAHQQDDYRYVTNAIYQRFLGDAFEIQDADAAKAELKDAVKAAEKLSMGGYTKESAKAFKNVLNDAKKVSKDNDVTYEEVEKALADLLNAQKNLVKKGNKK